MKYIVAEREDDEVEEIFIFPSSINHDCFMESIDRTRSSTGDRWTRTLRDPVAAGFTDGVTCWGRSETLDLDSRGEVDAKLITRHG